MAPNQGTRYGPTLPSACDASLFGLSQYHDPGSILLPDRNTQSDTDSHAYLTHPKKWYAKCPMRFLCEQAKDSSKARGPRIKGKVAAVREHSPNPKGSGRDFAQTSKYRGWGYLILPQRSHLMCHRGAHRTCFCMGCHHTRPPQGPVRAARKSHSNRSILC